jgi:choline dehydrogenase
MTLFRAPTEMAMFILGPERRLYERGWQEHLSHSHHTFPLFVRGYALHVVFTELIPLLILLPIACCYPTQMRRRNIVSQSELLSSYDFVIVGGGTAGLVLASRLSEDANTTVLVLEAGDTGDAVANSISMCTLSALLLAFSPCKRPSDIPGNAYYQSLWNSSYNWNFSTISQPSAGNRVLSWPRGKVLGGSSAINGMYSVRPSQIELDTWPSLSAPGDDSAKSKWGWQAMLAAMKKSETFVPPSTGRSAGRKHRV